MKVRFVLVAFVLPGFVAAVVVAGALWIVAVSYGDLGDALQSRKDHLQGAAALIRLLVPAGSESDSRSEADAVQRHWRQAGASEEELALLDQALERRRKLLEFAAATMPGTVETVKGTIGTAARAEADRAFGSGPQYDAGQAKLVSDVSRLIELGDTRTNRAVDAAWRALGHAIGIAIAAVALLLLATGVVAVLLRRSVLAPIRRLSHDIARAAQRNDGPAPLDPGTRIPEFQTIANAYNDLAQALEDEIRARLRMAVELQRARAAANAAARTRDALAARLRDKQNPGTPQSATLPSDGRTPDSQNSAASDVDTASPRVQPRGSRRRRRN